MKTLTPDLSRETHNRCMAYLEKRRYWDMLASAMRAVRDATDAQRREVLAALNTQVAYGIETRRITADDDAMLGSLLSLTGVNAICLGHEIDLTPETKPVGFAPNTCERVYVQSKGPEGLVRSRLAGWQIMSDGTTVPVPAGRPQGRWCMSDEANATATWPDGRIVNLGEAEIALLEDTTGGSR